MAISVKDILAALRHGRIGRGEAAAAIADLFRSDDGSRPGSAEIFAAIDRALEPSEAAEVRAALESILSQEYRPDSGTESAPVGDVNLGGVHPQAPRSDATVVPASAGETGIAGDVEPPASDETVYRRPTGRADRAASPEANASSADATGSLDEPIPPSPPDVEATVLNRDTPPAPSVIPASLGKSAISRAVESGLVIKNRFVLEKLIGHGGMGVVYSARDMRSEEAQDRDPRIAIKILSPEFRRHPLAFQALQREAKKAHTLSQRNIVTVFDFDRDDPLIYMTMELLEGQTLDALLGKRMAGLSREEGKPIVQAMCAGLGYAHDKGIVHSDFKPGNVFLTDGGTIKILDFGIARAVPISATDGSGKTVFDAGDLGGLTPAYAAPEVFAGGPPHPADDVFSLGLVVYELMSGSHPFDRLPASEAAQKKLVPKRIKRLKRGEWKALSRALSFERRERQQHATEFWEQYHGRKALMRRVAVAAILLPVVTGGIAYYTAEDDGFSRLPPEDQAAVRSYLERADGARGLYERGEAPLQDMFESLNLAYAIHPANKQVRKGLEFVADETIEAAPGIERRLSMKALLRNEYLKEYPPLVRAADERASDQGS